jgi:large subunit ribosomal protein L14
MKGLTSKVSKSLTIGSRLICHDNSGAKELEIIGAKGYKGTRGRYVSAGIAQIVTASVKKGKPDMIKKIVKALIIRQKKEFKRSNGMRISFEDNAAVLVTDDGLPVGTEVKGVVAREIYERFPKVSAISAGII